MQTADKGLAVPIDGDGDCGGWARRGCRQTLMYDEGRSQGQT